MTDTCTTTVTGIWKLGDSWRDLREEVALAGKPVVAVTTALSIRIIDVEHGFHQRVPTSDSAPYIAGDGFEIELTEVRVATPCGLVLAGSLQDSTSSSMPLILLCAIDDTSDKGLLAVAHAAAAAMGAKRLGDGHPDEACGALHCEVERP